MQLHTRTSSSMENIASKRTFFRIFFILSCYNLVPLVFTQSTDHTLTHCLTINKITNFTSLHKSSSDHDHFYMFSLQNLRYGSSKTSKPAAIILPESKEQLVNAVACCRKSSMEITIRSGGHSYEGMSSTTHGKNPFIIIDLMNLNRVTVDIESETAWVESGATLGELYTTIAEHSSYYGFPAGVSSTVGVGGHFSGGGFGVMGRKYGLAADNVLDAVLIDATGRVLDRAGMGEDVFWALRGGGGGNFGVVYAWKVQLVKVPKTVSCFSVYKFGSKHELAKLVLKYQLVAPHLDDGFHIYAFLSTYTNNVYVNFKGFYLGSKTEAMSIIDQHFPELNLTYTAFPLKPELQEVKFVEMSWIESVIYFSDLPAGSTIEDLKSRHLARKTFFKLKSDYVRQSISIEGLEGLLDKIPLEPKGHIILDPYGGLMDRISSDTIAFPHRSGNLYNILYAILWAEEDQDKEDQYMSWVRGIYDYMTPFVSSNPRATYINYVDLELGITDHSRNDNDIVSPSSEAEKKRSWGKQYFLGNYDRLVRAKNIIDPQNIFNHKQGIPPSHVHADSGSVMKRMYRLLSCFVIGSVFYVFFVRRFIMILRTRGFKRS